MVFYSNLEKRKYDVRNYIRQHPTATHRELRRNLNLKIEKVYAGGMKEAFSDAEIDSPRNFERLTSEKKRKIVIDYIRKNPAAGGHTIRKETKINFLTVFENTEKAFEAAGIPYTRKNNVLFRGKDSERRQLLFTVLNANPHISIDELMRLCKVNVYHHFKNANQLYAEAGLKYEGKGVKRRLAKKRAVIDYIKRNNLATQRDINGNCNTHVQLLFDNGIFDAYREAGISFPFERLNFHGTVLKNIKDEARLLEEEVARRLSSYGAVHRLVKTKRGFADIILERNNKKVAIEVKNYKSHEISISQVKQLNKYLEDIHVTLGFLICLKKPSKDTFLIGDNRIYVLEESELNKIPKIIDKDP
ncbi:MAG: hypothetical protein AABX53_00600 [Nanoarchaeota archaeon]